MPYTNAGYQRTKFGRAFRLSSNWRYFSEVHDRLKVLLSRLKYPAKLVNSTISCFVAVKAAFDQLIS